MKASKGIYILFIVFLIFSSCKELFVTTKVNKDGSFTRIITITGDSAEIVNATTPYPTDSLWERKFSSDSADSSKFILTYSKNYKNVEILNAEIMNDTGTMSFLSRKIDISKQFGFFYSYLRFKETYEAYNPFPNMDYKKYLSNEDLDLLSGITKIYSHADSLKLEKAKENQENFLFAGATEEVLIGLKEGMSRLNDANLTPQLIEQQSDSISSWIKIEDVLSDTAIFNLLQEKTGITAFSKLLTLDPPALQTYTESMERLFKILEFDSFVQTVEMPGIITATNSTSLKGNKVEWDVNSDSFLVKANIMHVESRIVNYWAFILTGFILLGFVTVLLLKGFKR